MAGRAGGERAEDEVRLSGQRAPGEGNKSVGKDGLGGEDITEGQYTSKPISSQQHATPLRISRSLPPLTTSLALRITDLSQIPRTASKPTRRESATHRGPRIRGITSLSPHFLDAILPSIVSQSGPRGWDFTCAVLTALQPSPNSLGNSRVYHRERLSTAS